MTEQKQQEIQSEDQTDVTDQQPNKQQRIRKAIEDMTQLLYEIETLQDDIDLIAQRVADEFDIKKATLKALAQEKKNKTSSHAIAKHQDILDELEVLFKY